MSDILWAGAERLRVGSNGEVLTVVKNEGQAPRLIVVEPGGDDRLLACFVDDAAAILFCDELLGGVEDTP